MIYRILILALLAIPALAEEWPKGTEGGLEIARDHCLKPEISPNALVVFEFTGDEGEHVTFPVRCYEVLAYLRDRDTQGDEL